MKKYEELTAYEKVDFLTEVLDFNEKRVIDFLILAFLVVEIINQLYAAGAKQSKKHNKI